jgi:transposase
MGSTDRALLKLSDGNKAGWVDCGKLGRGKKPRWQESDWQALQQWLEEPRRYSARQLSQRLAVERGIDLGAQQVRRILKKNYCWKLSPKAPPTPKPQLMTGCASSQRAAAIVGAAGFGSPEVFG